jgi:alanine-synthesizing transaminase
MRLSRVRLCASTPVQVAAVEALRGPQDHISEMVSRLKRRRDFSLKRLSQIDGLSAAKPNGAFYIFPKIKQIGATWSSDQEFVSELLKETGVLVVHGSGFDPMYGKNHFRMVFLPEESMLERALTAVDNFMKRHG